MQSQHNQEMLEALPAQRRGDSDVKMMEEDVQVTAAAIMALTNCCRQQRAVAAAERQRCCPSSIGGLKTSIAGTHYSVRLASFPRVCSNAVDVVAKRAVRRRRFRREFRRLCRRVSVHANAAGKVCACRFTPHRVPTLNIRLPAESVQRPTGELACTGSGVLRPTVAWLRRFFLDVIRFSPTRPFQS